MFTQKNDSVYLEAHAYGIEPGKKALSLVAACHEQEQRHVVPSRPRMRERCVPRLDKLGQALLSVKRG